MFDVKYVTCVAALSVMALMSDRLPTRLFLCSFVAFFVQLWVCLYVVFILSVYLMNKDVYVNTGATTSTGTLRTCGDSKVRTNFSCWHLIHTRSGKCAKTRHWPADVTSRLPAVSWEAIQSLDTMASSYCDSIVCPWIKRKLTECISYGWQATNNWSTATPHFICTLYSVLPLSSWHAATTCPTHFIRSTSFISIFRY